MSSYASTETSKNPPARADQTRKRIRKRIKAIALLAVILLCFLIPATFRLAIRQSLILLARQRGIDLGFRRINGNVFEPVSFYGVTLSNYSSAGTRLYVQIGRADVDFSLFALFFKRGEGCLRSIRIDGLNGKTRFQSQTRGETQENISAPPASDASWFEKMVPSRLEATHVNMIFQQGDGFLQFQNLRCRVDNLEPGTVEIDKLVVHQSWLSKTFQAVSGVTALQNSKISVSNISLEKGIRVVSASSDFAEIGHGRLKIGFDISAFAGSIRGEINRTSFDPRSMLEANGSFAQISISPLATFLGYMGESGGVIKEGKFSFHGSLRDLDRATVSVRMEATDFRLGKRQWNSLVGGATMVEHRVQIPELHLKQNQNELSVKGEMTLPATGEEWWQPGFAFDIAAKIDNLTELSALFGPYFAEMAGKVSIDGAIKGMNQSFTGELGVSGSGLSYRGVPLDTLHASIKLNGNELQVARLELTNKSDFLSGKGVVNILGEEKRYWGELKASVADLARYSAILQKPIVPQPLAGGMTVEWSGDGVAKAHSGAFHAQLKKFRLVSITEPKAHPLNADLEATYSPGNIFFSKFVLWDNNTDFSAKITATPKTLNLQSILLQQENSVRLQGDALLPFNIWSAWENASFATLLEFDAPCKVSLAGKNLDLHEAALLSGRQLPVKGDLNINVSAEGSLTDLKTSGRLRLKKGEIVLEDDDQTLIGADANFAFGEQGLKIENSIVRLGSREIEVNGNIILKNLWDPNFDFAIRSKKIQFSLRSDVTVDTDLDLNVRGTFGEAVISGTAQLLDLKLSNPLDASLLIADGNNLNVNLSPPFNPSLAPFNAWRVNVDVTTPEQAKLLWPQKVEVPATPPIYAAPGSLVVNGKAFGKGAVITLSGEAIFKNIVASSPLSSWMVSDGVLLIPYDQSPAWLAIGFSGTAEGENLTGWIFGRDNEKSSFYFSTHSLTEEELFRLVITDARLIPSPVSDISQDGDVSLDLMKFSSPAESIPAPLTP